MNVGRACAARQMGKRFHHKLWAQMRAADANMNNVFDGLVGETSPVAAADIVYRVKQSLLGLCYRLSVLGWCLWGPIP